MIEGLAQNHQEARLDLEIHLRKLDAVRSLFHEKLSKITNPASATQICEKFERIIQEEIDQINNAIDRALETAQNPNEAISLIAQITYNYDYNKNADEPRLPTLMSIESKCKKRARELKWDGIITKELYADPKV